MNLNHLRYFEEVCKHQNITKASEVLHVSQPSVTAAIKELENQYSIQLFVRANNRISLTPKGEEFLGLAKKFLNAYDGFHSEVIDLNVKKKVTLKVGIPSVLATFFMKKFIPSFEEKYPDIELEFIQIPTMAGIEWLSNSSLDLLIGISAEKPYPNCDSKLIFETSLVLATSSKNPLSKEKNITSDMLFAKSLVIISKGSYHYDTIMAKFKNVPVRIMAQSNQLSTIKYLVENDYAMTIIYKEVFASNPNICCVPFDVPMAASISVFWKKNCYMCKAMKTFIQFTQEIT